MAEAYVIAINEIELITVEKSIIGNDRELRRRKPLGQYRDQTIQFRSIYKGLTTPKLNLLSGQNPARNRVDLLRALADQ